MKFRGTVESRTSGGQTSGPPGEAELLKLNPERRELLMSSTKWATLEPGTLNLAVENQVLDQLIQFKPAITERGSDVHYPSPYEHIPSKRKQYFYYWASAVFDSKVQEVLVRRAEVPVPGRVELFAPVYLRSELGLSDGDIIEVEVR